MKSMVLHLRFINNWGMDFSRQFIRRHWNWNFRKEIYLMNVKKNCKFTMTGSH